MKRWAVWALVAVVVGAAGSSAWYFVARPVFAQDRVTVRVLTLKPGPFDNQTLAPGTTAAAREEPLRAPFYTEGVHLLVQEGEGVEAGQPIAKLRAEDLLRNLQAAEVNDRAAHLQQAQLLREVELQPERARLQLAAAANDLEAAKSRLGSTLTRLDRQSTGARERLEQAKRDADAVNDRYAGLAISLNDVSTTRSALEKAMVRAARQPSDRQATADLDSATQVYRDALKAFQQQQQDLDRNLKRVEEGIRSAQRELDVLDPDDNPDATDAKVQVDRAGRALAQVQTEQKATSVLPEQLEHAAAQLRQTEADFNRMRDRWEGRVLKSPIAGVVLSLPAKEGEPAQQGTVLAVVAEVANLKVRLRVDESDLGWLQVGQDAILKSTAYPGEAFRGSLVRIAPQATVEEGKAQSLLTVEAAVTNTDGRLRPGMNVQGEIMTQVSSSALVLPLSAVQEEMGRTYVWVVRGGRVQRVEVELGTQARGRVEVRRPLAAGERVVIGPPASFGVLRSGLPVTTEDSEGAGGP